MLRGVYPERSEWAQHDIFPSSAACRTTSETRLTGDAGRNPQSMLEFYVSERAG